MEVMLERGGLSQLNCLRKLGFGHCRLSIAVPEEQETGSVSELQGQRIATSYPELTRHLLEQRDVRATIVELSGSVEIAPGLGTADALYGRIDGISTAKRELLDRLLARLEGVMQAAESKYVMLHAPREALQKITELLPGVEHPSVMPLEGSDRIAVHAVCGEQVFWEHLEALKAVGASAILVLPVEKMLA
jgi:ATP phosphoribosyltransferase